MALLTPAPGDPKPTSGFHGYPYTHTCRNNTLTFFPKKPDLELSPNQHQAESQGLSQCWLLTKPGRPSVVSFLNMCMYCYLSHLPHRTLPVKTLVWTCCAGWKSLLSVLEILLGHPDGCSAFFNVGIIKYRLDEHSHLMNCLLGLYFFQQQGWNALVPRKVMEQSQSQSPPIYTKCWGQIPLPTLHSSLVLASLELWLLSIMRISKMEIPSFFTQCLISVT